MRFVVLLLGLLAALGAGGAGAVLLLSASASYVQLGLDADGMLAEKLSAKQKLEHRENYDKGFRMVPFFFMGGFMAFLGSLFAVFRRKKSAAALFLVAAIGPPILAVGTKFMLDPLVLGPSVLLLIVGVLALLIGPKKEAPVEPEEELEELEVA